jgi:hypothetical protein
MALELLDGSLQVEVYYDPSDGDFEDNICISFREDCPEDEKVFWAGETNIYLTPEQAQAFAMALIAAADKSLSATRSQGGEEA